jgi:hypothetical protein
VLWGFSNIGGRGRRRSSRVVSRCLFVALMIVVCVCVLARALLARTHPVIIAISMNVVCVSVAGGGEYSFPGRLSV